MFSRLIIADNYTYFEIDLDRLEYISFELFLSFDQITWIQRVGEFLYEVGEPHSGYDHREADQLHGKIEQWLLRIRRSVHQRHCQQPTPKNGRSLRQSHLGTL